MGIDSATRLYASTIAIVAGIYAIASPLAALMQGPMMELAALGFGGWIMLAIGAVVLVHGILVLAPAAGRLKKVSGPLMVVWAAIMLVNQGLLAALPAWRMSGGAMGGGGPAADMGWDAGMVAIAGIMLASGIIMSRRGTSEPTR